MPIWVEIARIGLFYAIRSTPNTRNARIKLLVLIFNL